MWWHNSTLVYSNSYGIAFYNPVAVKINTKINQTTISIFNLYTLNYGNLVIFLLIARFFECYHTAKKKQLYNINYIIYIHQISLSLYKHLALLQHTNLRWFRFVALNDVVFAQVLVNCHRTIWNAVRKSSFKKIKTRLP